MRDRNENVRLSRFDHRPTFSSLAAAVFIAVATTTAPGAAAEEAAPVVIHVIDGDTVEQDGVRWRLVGLDAPEIHRAKCPAERQRGIVAAARLVALLKAHGGELVPERRARDKYGRRLGRLLIAGEDWAEISVREGLAVRWDGTGLAPNWC